MVARLMNIQQDDFVPLHPSKDVGYNAHYKLNKHTVSVSYGGICYGSGFWNKANGSVAGSFEACVFDHDGNVIPGEDGEDVRGWLSLDDVNDLLLQYS